MNTIYPILENKLLHNGYQKITSNVPQIVLFTRKESAVTNVIYVLDCSNGYILTKEQFEHIKHTMEVSFAQKEIRINALSLFLTKNYHHEWEISRDDPQVWFIDVVNDLLIVTEDKNTDFFGIRALLEEVVTQDKVGRDIANKNITTNIHHQLNGLPIVTILLIAVNVLLYLWCTLYGDMLYNYGVLYGSSIWQDKEYYRFITAIFLHADASHLANNMIYLFLLGQIVEKKIKKIPFLFIYFCSGLGGGLVSVLYDLMVGEIKGTIGASGAIFGVTGALLVLVITHKGKVGNLTMQRVMIFAFLMLYSGFTSTNTDNAAHIGGFLIGFVLMMILSLIKYMGKKIGISGGNHEN